MATGVAGHGQFRAVRLEPSFTVLGAHGLHAGSSKGGDLPVPVAGECEVGVDRPGVGGMARSLAWSSEHVGRTLLRGAGEEDLAALSIGSDAPFPCEHLPLPPAF